MYYINPAFALFTFVIFGFNACQPKTASETRNDFKKYYDSFQVDGSFVLYNPQDEKYIFYNPKQFEQVFIPASTFKICNSLIGLETGVIPNENFVIPWDSTQHQNPSWNADHDLTTAFKNSTVWYYRELARRVGPSQMNFWLHKANYGNADTTGGIDKFWLTGGLRITPKQQIDFLQRLHDGKLPFSKRSMDIVKNIMIMKKTPVYTLRAKTGWAWQGGKDIGWYIGYLETKNKVYYFANCIQSTDSLNASFSIARTEIADRILKDLKLIEE